MARLRMMTERQEQVFTIGERFSMGRAATNSLPLPEDKAVSREHAVVKQRGNGYVLQDLESSNGTYLERGDQKWLVSGETQLMSGDVIHVGVSKLTFEEAVPPHVLDAGLTSIPGQTVVGRVLPVPRESVQGSPEEPQ